MALSATEYGEMTFRDFMRRVRAHRRQQEARYEERLDGWRQTRWLGTLLLNLNRGEDDPVQKPEEVLPLPGDPQPEEISPEELDAELARVAALDTDWL